MKRLLALLPAIVYAGAIAYASHLPALFPLTEPFGWDKLLHALVYAGFGLCLAFALAAYSPGSPFGTIALWTLVIGALYAVMDELHQLFVPYRVADIADWVADTIGISLSLPISRLLFLRWQRWLLA